MDVYLNKFLTKLSNGRGMSEIDLLKFNNLSIKNKAFSDFFIRKKCLKLRFVSPFKRCQFS